jgi:eukaryotic-like serine/threonine-protein kinase
MELLGGCDLERYTRPARLLPEPVVLRLAERMARALGYAHSRGVVHRDVKPANVIVDWSSHRVTLTDFGIARAAGAESTRTGLVLGSPVYMSPEQLAGAPADARGDLYALGVMLFQLLSGRLPHESHSLGDLLRQVAHETAPDLRQIRPELPAALAALVASLLAKAPGARARNAELVANTLAALAAPAPTP